jgi:flagellar biosynthesis/type III secretory pathway protein FliH
MSRNRIIAVGALVALLAVTGVAYASHVSGQYKIKDDAYRALAIRTDTAHRNATDDARRTATQAAAALKAAVAKQKSHDTAVLRRIVRKMKSAARRKIDAAYKKGQDDGYSSGNAAGYSAGTENGLVQGSDGLTCSDDIDVSWLPFC